MKMLLNPPFYFAVALAFALSGCGDDTGPDPTRSESVESKPAVPQPTVGNFPPGEETLEQASGNATRTMEVAGPIGGNAALILESFRDDLATCARLIDALRSDVRLADEVEQTIINPTADFEDLLRGTRAYEHIAVRHLVSNRDFVRLLQSQRGDPYAAAVLESRGISCAPTRARLQEIERLGPSAAAWTVREYFLTGSLRAVRMPWTVTDGADMEFDTLRDEVEATARLYRGPLRQRLEAWLSNAANTLRREQAPADSTHDSSTREQHRQTVNEWIILLESLRSFRIDTKNS